MLQSPTNAQILERNATEQAPLHELINVNATNNRPG
jgi:hypothetical protein